MSQLVLNKQSMCFRGQVRYYTYESAVCNGPMNFSIFLPEQAFSERCPVLFWLSGITCTEDNFMVKAGVQRLAAKLGLIIVCPDTSPRTAQIPGENASWDLGQGAGFYVDATEAPWAAHYQMYRFVAHELPAVIDTNFSTNPSARGIFGHSMGGHGAIVVGLRNPTSFKSISAFAPICAPSRGPLGKKAFSAYLGTNEKAWRAYDSTAVLARAEVKTPILVYQGDADHLLTSDLMLDQLVVTAQEHNYPLTVQMKSGYDHSYFFVATFIDDHLNYHASILGG